jgi:putative transposase
VLEQAVLKRGLPNKLVIDNGAAYRAASLQGICARLDALFYHRVMHKVRKDATVSFEGRRFEVPYELAGRTVVLVDPHADQTLAVESEGGQPLGAVTALDAFANAHRKRRQPQPVSDTLRPCGLNAVELAYRQHIQALGDNPSTEEDRP